MNAYLGLMSVLLFYQDRIFDRQIFCLAEIALHLLCQLSLIIPNHLEPHQNLGQSETILINSYAAVSVSML